jgi:hypothetical protein
MPAVKNNSVRESDFGHESIYCGCICLKRRPLRERARAGKMLKTIQDFSSFENRKRGWVG